MGGQHTAKDVQQKEHRNEAVAFLWDAHAADLRTCLVKRGASHGDVDDLLADTFMALLQLEPGKLRKIKPGWLFTVALRRLVDRSRSEAVRQRHIERTRGPVRVDSFDNGLALRLDLEAALGGLSPRQRRAIELRYLEGHTVANVAETLCLSYDATESLLARGRRAMAAR